MFVFAASRFKGTVAGLALLVVAGGCGLKGPPIPPDAVGEPGARSGSGALRFGPHAPEEIPEDEKLFEMYGGKKPSASPRVEESLGVPAAPARSWIDREQGFDEQNPYLPAPAPSPTPPPAPAPAENGPTEDPKENP